MNGWHALVCSCLVVVAVSLLVGCGPGALNRSEALNPSAFREQGSDIARTFEYATIVLPGRHGEPPLVTRPDDDGLSRHLERFGQDVRFPTVLYLHGCTGLESLRPLQAFARQGFAVLAPNSFARRYRPLQCRPSERTGGLNVFVFDFRLTEITYALARITELDWVDRERLFLVGTSEGGLAAALYRGDDFRARVVTQWTCHGAPLVRGLAGPLDEPVLAVVRAGDPWYDPSRTPGQRGHCGIFMAGRPSLFPVSAYGTN